MISEQQEKNIVSLYKEQRYAITDIMRKTNVGSAQTIYKVLEKHGVRRQRRSKQIRKISVCLDEKTDEILRAIKPRNISDFVCNLIKKCAVV